MSVIITNSIGKRFPSGEIEVQIPHNVFGEDIFIFHRIHQPINSSILEVLLIALKCKDLGAHSVSLILPYLPYSRSEKSSLKHIYQLLALVGIQKIITSDIHSNTNQTEIQSIDFASHIIRECKIDLKDKIIVSPDKGGYARAKKVADEFKCEFICMDKKRSEEGIVHKLNTNVFNRKIVIIDDIIDSGKTISSAADLLFKMGAESIEVIATHLISSNEFDGIASIYVSNSIQHEILPDKYKVVNIDRILLSYTDISS